MAAILSRPQCVNVDGGGGGGGVDSGDDSFVSASGGDRDGDIVFSVSWGPSQ